jgi:site-specific recombinase XerC
VQSALTKIAEGADPLHAARDMALLLLAAQRGLRRAEIAALTMSDIDLDTHTIRVVRKGYSERVDIHIEGATLEALVQWVQMRAEVADPHRGSVFVGLGNRSRGKIMTPAAIYEVIKRAGSTQAGGTWSPHRLRHSAITETYRQSGDNILSAQQLAVSVRPDRSTKPAHSQLRSGLSVTPRHEFLKTVNLVICDTGQRVGEPGLRIDAVEFGRFDQRVGDGG